MSTWLSTCFNQSKAKTLHLLWKASCQVMVSMFISKPKQRCTLQPRLTLSRSVRLLLFFYCRLVDLAAKYPKRLRNWAVPKDSSILSKNSNTSSWLLVCHPYSSPLTSFTIGLLQLYWTNIPCCLLDQVRKLRHRGTKFIWSWKCNTTWTM